MPGYAFFGAVWLGITMVGAVLAHLGLSQTLKMGVALAGGSWTFPEAPKGTPV